MDGLFGKGKWIMRKYQYELFYDSCYDKMKAYGVAVYGKCCGVFGGDRNTDDTAESCLDCPYYSPVSSQER